MTNLSLVNILGAVGILGLLTWIAIDMPPAIQREEGKTTIRFAFWIRCFYLFYAFAIPLGLTLMAIVHRPPPEEMWCLFASYALIGFISWPMWWIVTRFALSISADGLECHSPWRRKRFVKWDELKEVTYGVVGRWYVLRARSGYRFRVSGLDHIFGKLAPGLDDFQAAVAQHRPEALRHFIPHTCRTSHLWDVVAEAQKLPPPPPAEKA
jgi:hypothetical protein